MANLERRVAALETEQTKGDRALKIIFQEDGVSKEEAIKRAGYPPDTDIAYVIFVSPLDERL